mmetsp:Transcript_25718/g.49259  ORF Transcript_25718/g.49259 Transcript_25718/m.49259 type:complete len:217 (-) Transcript_25718:829-1479(-)
MRLMVCCWDETAGTWAASPSARMKDPPLSVQTAASALPVHAAASVVGSCEKPLPLRCRVLCFRGVMLASSSVWTGVDMARSIAGGGERLSSILRTGVISSQDESSYSISESGEYLVSVPDALRQVSAHHSFSYNLSAAQADTYPLSPRGRAQEASIVQEVSSYNTWAVVDRGCASSSMACVLLQDGPVLKSCGSKRHCELIRKIFGPLCVGPGSDS